MVCLVPPCSQQLAEPIPSLVMNESEQPRDDRCLALLPGLVVASLGRRASSDANDLTEAFVSANALPWVEISFAVFFIALALAMILDGRCPRCKKLHALKTTGVLEKEGPEDVGREEWKCKHCGHRVWKKKRSPTSDGPSC